MNIHNLQKKCLERANEVYAIAEQHFDRPFKRVPILFSNKLTKTGGYFQFNFLCAMKIKLSNSILELNGQAFIDEVVGHEVAHHIVYELHGANEQAHGRCWKDVMRLFGQAPKARHNLKTVQAKNQFKYVKNGTEILMSSRRHHMIQVKGAAYRMRNVGLITAIDWVGSKHYTAKPKLTPAPAKRPTAPAKRKPTVKAKRKQTGLSKADIVRANIKMFKQNGFTLEEVLAHGTLVSNVATEANLTKGLCKTYLTNNWNK